MTIGDYYFNNSVGDVEIDVIMFVEDGIAEIYDISEKWFLTGVSAEFDEETGVMTFNNEYLGELEYEGTMDAISFMPFAYNQGIDFVGSFSVTYSEETESFEFPEKHGFSWPCWNSGKGESYLEDAKAFNSKAATFDSFYGLFNTEAMVKVTEGEDPEPGNQPGQGTEESPYTCADVIALNNPGTVAWVQGYIVGAMNANNKYTLEVAAPFNVASNVFIADSATETNTANMVAVQLVSGTDVREAVNLIDNPDNIGQLVAIKGSLEKYFSQAGLKSPTAYKFKAAEGEDPEPGEIEGIDAIAGVYEYTYSGLLQNMPAKSEVEITVVDKTTGEVSISGFPQNYKIKATYDPQTGTLKIANKQNLGPDSYGDINYFYFKGADSEGNLIDGATDEEYVEGSVTVDGIVFPPLSIWAIGDFDSEDLGWWWLSYRNEFIPISEDPTDPNEGWEDYCTATFEDGWILPGYTIGGKPALPSDIPWTVKVQYNIEDNSLLRLDNPYTAENCPIPASSVANGGYIVFSIADPEFIVVYPNIFSGAMNGSNKLYLFNKPGFYTAQGFDKETIIKQLGAEVGGSYDATTHVISIPQCGFNIEPTTSSFYTWSSSTGTSLAGNMNTKITLNINQSEIKNIEAVEDSVKVIYDIQGRRVANPTKGLYIINGKKALVK